MPKPRWNDGLVDAFPIPLDHQLSQLSLQEKNNKEEEEDDDDENIPINANSFRFFSLPAELRNHVYHLVLFSKPPYRLASGKRKGSRLAILLASSRFHQEASYALYTTHRFLIFPIQEFNALPTVQELPLYYRLHVTNLAIIVGSSWTDPPRSWRVTKSLKRCLANLTNVQTLSVFVEFDPSHPAFKRYRVSESFYTDFCGELLGDVLDAMPQLDYVQLDGNPGVEVHGPLVTKLREEAVERDKQIKWGKEAGWAHRSNYGSQALQPPLHLTIKSAPSARPSTRTTTIGHRGPALHKVLERVRDA